MKRIVNHASLTRHMPSGAIIQTTLCGRNRTLDDGMNVEDSSVTCKFCLKIRQRRPRGEPPAAQRKERGKFRVGQVVMVINKCSGDKYPVKLHHQDGIAWMDSLYNVEYEDEMRLLSVRESGRATKGGK